MRNEAACRVLTVFLVFILALSFFGRVVAQEMPAGSKAVEKEKPAPDKSQQEKIIPSPQNIKEGTAIYVFVAWMWLVIFILIYILRLKVRESDRLHEIRFFSREKK